MGTDVALSNNCREGSVDNQAYPLLPQMGVSKLSFVWESHEVRGKLRHFGKPNRAMRLLHQRINRQLFSVIDTTYRVGFEHATGGLPGRSPALNAGAHAKSRYFYQVDLKDAYNSVDSLMLAGALFALEPSFGDVQDIEYFLKMCCVHPKLGGPKQTGLITGAPLSPVLFNIYCAMWLDRKIGELCAHEGMVYTRFFDDLTISSTKPISKYLRKRVRAVILDARFVPHRRKSSVLDLMRGPVTITGVMLWWGGKRSATNKFLSKLDEVLSMPAPLMNEKDLSVLQGLLAHLSVHRGILETKNIPRYRVAIERKMQELRWQKKDKVRVHRSKKIRLERGVVFTPGLIDELRARIPIEEVVASKIKIRKRSEGREYVGLCPFHNEKTPSFTIAAKKGFYHCFGCGEHGDIFGFLMKTSGVSFPEAVRMLAKRYSIPLS
jgi:hypothetical protein